MKAVYKRIKSEVLFGSLLIATLFSVSFEASSQQQVQDSAQNSLEEQVDQYRQLVEESELKRKQDSVRKAELIQQISQLKANDRSQQAEKLKSQIQEIENKDSIRNTERNQKILSLKATAIGYPVMPFSDTLFMVYLKIGPVLPAERAASISRKIDLLYEDSFVDPDSITYTVSESTVDISYKDLIILSITDWDALWYSKTKEQLAIKYLETIRESIRNERELNSLYNILIRSGLALLIIAAVWFLIYILNRLSRKVNYWIIKNKERLFRGIKLKNYEILPPNRELAVVLKISTIIKWTVFAFLLYISLPLLFSIFPFTKGWATTLFSWIWEPTKNIIISIWEYLPNLITIIIIFTITRQVVKLFKFLAQEIENERLKLKGFHEDWAMPTFNILRVLLFAFMFVVIFDYLPGSESPVFRGVSVFLGILFSLGSSSAISNAVAGLVITYMRPYQINDRIKIGEVTGQVVEKSLLVTRVKTIKNEYITIPNASILTGHTINYSTAKENEEGVILNTTVTIGYDVPWRQVHELLTQAAEATDGILVSKLPFVLQTSLDDYYVSYQINAYTDMPEKMAVIYSDLHQNIQDKFNEAGVEILSPHYRAMRDGNTVATPSEYLPENYKAPAFRVKKED